MEQNQTNRGKEANARRQRVGRWGEAVAAQHLEGKGYRILARNVHSRYGEIDLIAEQGGELVFVEVKTRTNLEFGYPETAVDARKMEHLALAAQTYLNSQESQAGRSWRVDVIAVIGHPSSRDKDILIEHFENVGS